MYTDIHGKKRMKIGLHIHTTVSDGMLSQCEVAKLYKEAGYDAIALTDHWIWNESGEKEGLRIISGCEYNNTDRNPNTSFGSETIEGVYHILCIGSDKAPDIQNERDVQSFIDEIHKVGGVAILAHPAWSLNSVEQIKGLDGIDATEIYNTVSGVHCSNRAYSGAIVDLLANAGIRIPLTAADDSHYYDNDCAVSYIMLDVDDGNVSDKDIVKKIKNGEFYSTQGPEVLIRKEDDGSIIVDCSPACLVSFFSNASFHKERNVRGENITTARYIPKPFDKWIRAEVFDKDGKCAWSNIIEL